MMIQKKDIAKEISDLMVETHANFVESVMLVKKNCSNEEFETYRKKIGRIMGIIFTDIMNPIYKIHPELNPDEKRGTDE